MSSDIATGTRFSDREAVLDGHNFNNLLANGVYLVACFRETEQHPFSYMLLRGADVVLNGMPSYYRYFLLPPYQEASKRQKQ